MKIDNWKKRRIFPITVLGSNRIDYYGYSDVISRMW